MFGLSVNPHFASSGQLLTYLSALSLPLIPCTVLFRWMVVFFLFVFFIHIFFMNETGRRFWCCMHAFSPWCLAVFQWMLTGCVHVWLLHVQGYDLQFISENWRSIEMPSSLSTNWGLGASGKYGKVCTEVVNKLGARSFGEVWKGMHWSF